MAFKCTGCREDKKKCFKQPGNRRCERCIEKQRRNCIQEYIGPKHGASPERVDAIRLLSKPPPSPGSNSNASEGSTNSSESFERRSTMTAPTVRAGQNSQTYAVRQNSHSDRVVTSLRQPHYTSAPMMQQDSRFSSQDRLMSSMSYTQTLATLPPAPQYVETDVRYPRDFGSLANNFDGYGYGTGLSSSQSNNTILGTGYQDEGLAPRLTQDLSRYSSVALAKSSRHSRH